jgi:hypothetical protein
MSSGEYNNSTILERLKGLPELNIGDEMGPTGYIDFLKWDDVPEGVMYGYDKLNRLFFVIKCIIDGNKYVQTFFQRYESLCGTDIYAWNSGSSHLHIIDTNGGILDNQFDFLFELIKNKKAILKYEHRPSYSFTYKLNGIDFKKEITLFDKKKWDSAKTIQKSWRLCRYDPTYKMCSNVTLNNIKELEKEYNRIIIN